jgi:hypothetical protein
LLDHRRSGLRRSGKGGERTHTLAGLDHHALAAAVESGLASKLEPAPPRWRTESESPPRRGPAPDWPDATKFCARRHTRLTPRDRDFAAPDPRRKYFAPLPSHFPRHRGATRGAARFESVNTQNEDLGNDKRSDVLRTGYR